MSFGRFLVRPTLWAVMLLSVFVLAGCSESSDDSTDWVEESSAKKTFGGRLAAAAVERTKHEVTYDPKYVKIAYPGGDVPSDMGVCTDVVIRSYRAVGIDLQKVVHEDMRSNFGEYPKIWGLRSPDTNIDHRRVPNLMTYFKRQGATLSVTKDKDDYKCGDIVVWKMNGGSKHIGIVVWRKGSGGSPWVVHNYGAGPKAEDRLFDWEIIGHYRYPAEDECRLTIVE